MNKINVEFNDIEDFGTLCICAIRYCHGRRTYMPELVTEIISRHFDKLSDRDIQVMIDDCKFQEQANLYGDEYVDKPLWLKWRETLEAEKIKRNSACT